MKTLLTTVLVLFLGLVHLHSFSFSKHSLHSRRGCIQETARLHMLDVASIPSTLASVAAVASVVSVHEAGHFLAARAQGVRVSSFNVGYGPKLLSFNDSSQIEFALRALPLGGYVSFPANVELDEEGRVVRELPEGDLLQNQPPISRLLVISAGVVANLLLAVALSASVALTTGLGVPVFGEGVVVSSVAPPSPAASAGLRASDVIVRVDGAALGGAEDTVERFVATVRGSENRPLSLTVLRGPGAGQGREGKGVQEVQATVVPQRDPLRNRVSIGVGVNANVKEMRLRKGNNIIEAVQIGVEQTGRLLGLTWGALVRGVSTGFKGSDVGGPISVVSTGAQLLRQTPSPSSLLLFAASLSVNLALLNSLPLPLLDGGQFAFTFAELLAGRRVPVALQQGLTALSLLFFLGVFLLTSLGDLDRLFDPLIQNNFRR